MEQKSALGPWECDEVMTPFYNDAEGKSRGGDGAGYWEVFAPFTFEDADGETCTDTIVLAERVSKEVAYLIVAAPDLLEALKDMLARFDTEPCKYVGCQSCAARAKAHAAIAKASVEST